MPDVAIMEPGEHRTPSHDQLQRNGERTGEWIRARVHAMLPIVPAMKHRCSEILGLTSIEHQQQNDN